MMVFRFNILGPNIAQVTSIYAWVQLRAGIDPKVTFETTSPHRPFNYGKYVFRNPTAAFMAKEISKDALR